MNRGASLLLLFVVGCLQPYDREARWEEEEWPPFTTTGTSTICGQVVLKRGAENVNFASGNTVKLIPVTSYTKETFQLAIIEGAPIEKTDSRLAKFQRFTKGDADGKFCFKNLPAGNYYLVSEFQWHVSASYSTARYSSKGGVAYAETSVKPNERVDVIVTDEQ